MTSSKPLYLSFTIITVFILAVIIDSCTEQRFTTQPNPDAASKFETSTKGDVSPAALVPFNKAVGSPITAQIGLGWIRNFVNANPGVANEYFIQGITLQKIVAAN